MAALQAKYIIFANVRGGLSNFISVRVPRFVNVYKNI